MNSQSEACDDVGSEYVGDIKKFKVLYEQNVGLINPIVGDWLFEVCEKIDYELFKRAIEIATDKGKCNKGYINGILKQWNDNNIKSLSDLKAYELIFALVHNLYQIHHFLVLHVHIMSLAYHFY